MKKGTSGEERREGEGEDKREPEWANVLKRFTTVG